MSWWDDNPLPPGIVTPGAPAGGNVMLGDLSRDPSTFPGVQDPSLYPGGVRTPGTGENTEQNPYEQYRREQGIGREYQDETGQWWRVVGGVMGTMKIPGPGMSPFATSPYSGGVVTPGQPGPGGTPTQPPQNYQQIFQQLTQGRAPTPQELIGLEGQLGQYGIKVLRNAAGVAGKIQLPNGQIVDVIEAAGLGGRNWQWDTGPGGAGGGVPGAPYATYGTGGGPYPLYGVGGGGFMQPFDVAFRPPSAADMQNEPGWQFRMQEGLKAIERAGAAKGTVLSGGMLKDLNAWAQGLASSEYDRLYNRRFNEYGTAFNVFNANMGNQWNRLNQMAGYGAGASEALANQATGYGYNLANLYGQQGNAIAQGQAASGNVWGGFWPYVGDLISESVPIWWPKPKDSTPPSEPWQT